jgi:tRNA threonylcarbamoyladenosine modification (KEOPS) complex  Pcc1 subunit
MKASTVIALHFPSKKRLEVVLKALKPETERHQFTRRSKVNIGSKQNNLLLNFEAADTSALRAAINSYLRWVMLMSDSFQAIEELNKR